ncbi:hypothetical protein N8K70_01630 [Microbacterium betulae]|uniref:Uncharacterized protein n=1 Tax=Microbacterium betulae TaxID=2981139 RepID=A0AA97I7A2_9MICO|nr:hypothetical protein [Microbacterium sp. AB]WOF23402.1 hypothetical protein N8K70_01630 [Microbacterium sp. AB]
MVTLLLDHSQLEIVLSPTERALAFQRGSIRVERTSIAKVQLTDDPWTWLRGVRSRGTHVPGAVALGTWKSESGDDFVAVRGRRLPGVVIDLLGEGAFQRLVISTRHGLALTRALRLDPAEASEVAAFGTPTAPASQRKPRRKPAARPVPAV